MLDKIIQFSIHNKIIIAMMIVVWIIWGLWSTTKLPIDAVPDITDNQVQIITVCPTLAGQEVEQLVTFPIEQSIANLPHLEETRSISRFGLSVITVIFGEDIDVYFARQLVNEKLKQAQENIPEGIGTPELAPVSTGLGEVYQYIIHPKKDSEHKYNAKDLRTMQDWIVVRQLNGTPGIAEINSFGGELKQYEVAINPNRLRAMGVSIADILNALERNNENTGGAYIDKKPDAYFIRGIGLVKSLEDIQNIAVKNTASVPIYIRDVAEVRYGHALRYGALSYNGEIDAVGGVVMMLKGANSNEVVRRIKEKLPAIQKALPEDIVIEAYLDRTDLVGRTISTVQKNLIEGALIVIFVLVLFLGNLRAGLIVASVIPLSMLFALGMMQVFGVSGNLMSLGAIDFGLIVDGAVIVVEATLHHLGMRRSLHKRTQPQMDEEVCAAASKIRSSAAFGEIVILIVYVPVLTLAGVEGKMFRPMAQTVGFAILGALILSLTYVPVMCAAFLPKTFSPKPTFSDKMIAVLQRLYTPLLQKAIRIKYRIISLSVLCFGLSVWLFSRMGGAFIPTLAEGDFAFHCILQPGASLSQSLETSMQASRIIKSFEEVKMVVGKTGAAEIPTDPMPPEATDIMVILKPKKEWKSNKSYETLADAIMQRLEVIPGVYFEKNQPIQMRFNELMTGIRQDVAVKIFGENLDTLYQYAQKVSQVIQSIAGTTAPQIERVNKLPQINIIYDRIRMANYGLTIKDVNNMVSTAFAGKKAGVVFENERRFDLVLRLDSPYRQSIGDVRNLMIPIPSGNQIPLSQVAHIDYKSEPAQISRESSQRRIVIGFNVKGRDVASVVKDIQAQLHQLPLPSGYYFTYGGTFENLQKASQRLMIVVPLSLLLIFMLLYFTFSSFKQAGLIFTAIPMSAIGGVAALLMRGIPFSISAGVGFIALFGVAVLNGIVLISTFNQLAKDGMTDIRQRVLEGTRIRLRPVLMTALAASLGFLPMALSTSAGAEVQRPLATVVIGGLITATLLTLFVLPLLYIIASSASKSKVPLKPFTLLLLLTTPFLGHAQTTKVLSIDEAIQTALTHNPGIQARTLDIEASQRLKKTAFELPKLDLNVQLGQYNSIFFDQNVQLTQTFPFPTLFSANKQWTQAQVTMKELQKAITIAELKSQVRSYYYQLQYLNHYRSKLQSLDSLYAAFMQVVALKVKTGETKSTEINVAAIKRNNMHLLLQQNNLDIKTAYHFLQTLLHTQDSIAIALTDIFTPLELSNHLVIAEVIKNNPALQILYQSAVLTEGSRKIEKAKALPDFTLGYGNQSLIGFGSSGIRSAGQGEFFNANQEKFFSAKNRFHYFNVGVSIPLTYGANKARLRALSLQQQSEQTQAHYQQSLLETQLRNAFIQYHQDKYQYQYYQTQALPHAGAILKAAQLGYQTGDIDYVEYLFTLQTAADIELKYLNSIQKINQTVIYILSLINQ